MGARDIPRHVEFLRDDTRHAGHRSGYPLPVPAGPGFLLVKDLILFAGAVTMAAEAAAAAGIGRSQPMKAAAGSRIARAA